MVNTDVATSFSSNAILPRLSPLDMLSVDAAQNKGFCGTQVLGSLMSDRYRQCSALDWTVALMTSDSYLNVSDTAPSVTYRKAKQVMLSFPI